MTFGFLKCVFDVLFQYTQKNKHAYNKTCNCNKFLGYLYTVLAMNVYIDRKIAVRRVSSNCLLHSKEKFTNH